MVDGALEICELVLRVLLSIFGLVGLFIFAMGIGIAPLQNGLVVTLKVVHENTQRVMIVIGPMIFLGAVGLWTMEMSEDIGAVLVPIGHLGLFVPPCGAVYLHKKTGETMAPPALVSTLTAIHLILWLVRYDGDEVAVAMAIAVLVVWVVETVVIGVAVLLATPNEPNADDQVSSLELPSQTEDVEALQKEAIGAAKKSEEDHDELKGSAADETAATAKA